MVPSTTRRARSCRGTGRGSGGARSSSVRGSRGRSATPTGATPSSSSSAATSSSSVPRAGDGGSPAARCSGWTGSTCGCCTTSATVRSCCSPSAGAATRASTGRRSAAASSAARRVGGSLAALPPTVHRDRLPAAGPARPGPMIVRRAVAHLAGRRARPAVAHLAGRRTPCRALPPRPAGATAPRAVRRHARCATPTALGRRSIHAGPDRGGSGIAVAQLRYAGAWPGPSPSASCATTTQRSCGGSRRGRASP